MQYAINRGATRLPTRIGESLSGQDPAYLAMWGNATKRAGIAVQKLIISFFPSLSFEVTKNKIGNNLYPETGFKKTDLSNFYEWVPD